MSKYMTALILAGILPFILSFYPRLKFWQNLRPLISSIGLIVVIFGIWDIFAVYRGHWYFNPQGVWNFRIINLPIEEVLFFVIIPFCCIFTWETIKYIKETIKT